MDNGTIDIDWKLMEKLALVLGYTRYDPAKDNEYLSEAIHFLNEYFGD